MKFKVVMKAFMLAFCLSSLNYAEMNTAMADEPLTEAQANRLVSILTTTGFSSNRCSGCPIWVMADRCPDVSVDATINLAYPERFIYRAVLNRSSDGLSLDVRGNTFRIGYGLYSRPPDGDWISGQQYHARYSFNGTESTQATIDHFFSRYNIPVSVELRARIGSGVLALSRFYRHLHRAIAALRRNNTEAVRTELRQAEKMCTSNEAIHYDGLAAEELP